MMLSALLPLALLGCNGGDEQTFTSDVRIDKAVDGADPDSFGTKMCVTDGGVVYVLWLDDREDPGSESYDIWLNRSVNRGGTNTDVPDLTTADDSGWLQAAVKVNQGDGNVFFPDLTCNETGVFVVWEDDRDGELENHQIYFNRSTDQGETFQAEDLLLEVDLDGFSMSLEPKIVASGQDLAVVWYDSVNGAYDILVTTSGDAGATFRVPSRVDSDDPPGSAYSARPQIAMSDNADKIWVVWEDSRDGAADVYFASSNDGGVTFAEDVRLDEGDEAPGAHDSFEPQICADAVTNQLYVVWHDARNNPQNRDIYLNYSPDGGGGWLPVAQRIDSDNPGFANSLFPVCTTMGNEAHVAWADSRANGGYDIYYRRVLDGIPGADEVRLDQGTPEGFANSLDTRIANDGDTIVVAWRDGRADVTANNGYDDLYYNYSQGGAPFVTNADEVDGEGDFRIDSMYDGQSFKLDLNLSVLGGEWYAAWTDGRGGTSDIYFQRMGVGKEAKPPKVDAAEAEGTTTP